MTDKERLISRVELMERWGISRSTIQRMEREKRLPSPITIGKRTKFSIKDIKRLEADGKSPIFCKQA